MGVIDGGRIKEFNATVLVLDGSPSPVPTLCVDDRPNARVVDDKRARTLANHTDFNAAAMLRDFNNRSFAIHGYTSLRKRPGEARFHAKTPEPGQIPSDKK